MAWDMSTRRSRLPKDWPARRCQILQRDPTCRLRFDGCTNLSTEVDHVQRGDDHSAANLAGVCQPCHKRKTAWEAAQARRGQPKGPTTTRPTESHPGLL